MRADRCISDTDVAFSVAVEPAIVEQHAHHSPLRKVVLALSGPRGEIQISCRREESGYMQVNLKAPLTVRSVFFLTIILKDCIYFGANAGKI